MRNFIDIGIGDTQDGFNVIDIGAPQDFCVM
jgi:hypothetical protein